MIISDRQVQTRSKHSVINCAYALNMLLLVAVACGCGMVRLTRQTVYIVFDKN